MTDYTKRLDEILDIHDNLVLLRQAAGDNGNELRDTTKQAITSLIKELVVEAKPVKYIVQDDEDIYDDYDHDKEQLRHELQENNINIGHNSAIDQFEQNLLEVLGYEDEK